MTTSWAYFADGRWRRSLEVNAGGFCLAIYACVATIIAAGWAIQGSPPRQSVFRVMAWALIAIALITVVD
ncbi:MAG: hypothetical protein AAF745_16700, partial [Planctomycetota bacterium]